MKKIISILTFFITIINIIFFYDRHTNNSSFGPTAMIIGLTLILLFLFFLISLILYETRYKGLVQKIYMIISSTLITFLVVEFIASYFLLQSLSPKIVPDEYRHHKLVPNTYSYFEQPDFSYIHRVNNFGLRGKDIDIEKSPNKYRIMMLGDSFTMGKGVEDDETFTVILNSLLNRNKFVSSVDTIEILNGGVDSYAPILSFIYLFLSHRLVMEIVQGTVPQRKETSLMSFYYLQKFIIIF